MRRRTRSANDEYGMVLTPRAMRYKTRPYMQVNKRDMLDAGLNRDKRAMRDFIQQERTRKQGGFDSKILIPIIGGWIRATSLLTATPSAIARILSLALLLLFYIPESQENE